MTLWLNSREPPYMAGTESGSLTNEQIAYAANCLTYEGMQYLAAMLLVWLNTAGYSPAQIMAMVGIEEPATNSACADTH